MDTGNITLDNARPATWSADRRRYEERISAIVIEQLMRGMQIMGSHGEIQDFLDKIADISITTARRMADKIFTAD